MDKLLERGVAKVLPSTEALQKRLQQGPVRLYIGVDPTGSRLHLGHTIGLRKLMEFAAAGHQAILLFGTGTVMVGDPSLRDTARKLIDPEQIQQNLSTWKQQVSPIIDFEKVEIRFNGDWLADMTLKELVKIASNVTAVQLFKRESFTRRIANGDTVWYHETMYPLLQGYDSVAMDVDLEIGGTDQEFNMLMGRELQQKMNGREKFVLTVPMINGPDGQPMSKTRGNCVWLDDSAHEMYGKLMTTLDEQIIEYLDLLTDVPHDEVVNAKQQLKTGANPRDVKATMAHAVVTIWHGEQAADEAAAQFQSQFSDGQLPADIADYKVGSSLVDLRDVLVQAGLVRSRSQVQRLLEQGGIHLGGEPATTATVSVTKDVVVRVGKRRYLKLVR